MRIDHARVISRLICPLWIGIKNIQIETQSHLCEGSMRKQRKRANFDMVCKLNVCAEFCTWPFLMVKTRSHACIVVLLYAKHDL